MHHQAYREVVERQFGPWVEEEQDRFFERDWAASSFEVVLCDGVPCGYLCVEERVADVHVREIALLPEFQGRGIGTALLRDAIERACKRSVPVKLGTFEKSRAAALYRRLGFREIERAGAHVLFTRVGDRA